MVETLLNFVDWPKQGLEGVYHAIHEHHLNSVCVGHVRVVGTFRQLV